MLEPKVLLLSPDDLRSILMATKLCLSTMVIWTNEHNHLASIPINGSTISLRENKVCETLAATKHMISHKRYMISHKRYMIPQKPVALRITPAPNLRMSTTAIVHEYVISFERPTFSLGA